jgi:hypothetical protein
VSCNSAGSCFLNIFVRVSRVTTFAYGIDVDAANPESGFRLLSTFETLRVTLKLEGSSFFVTDESNRITVYDVMSGEIKYMLRVPLLHNDQTVFLEVSLAQSIQLCRL